MVRLFPARTVLGAAAAAACWALAAPAAAQPVAGIAQAQPYVGARLALARPLFDEGGSDSPWAFGRGHAAGLSGGFAFGSFIAEAELTLATLNAADGSRAPDGPVTGQEHLASLLMNGRWQPRVNGLLHAVFGAGAGMTRVEWDNVRRGDAELSAADSAPTYVLDFGFGSHFWGALAFEVTWRHVGLGAFDYVEADGAAARMPSTQHDLLRFGLRYEI